MMRTNEGVLRVYVIWHAIVSQSFRALVPSLPSQVSDPYYHV